MEINKRDYFAASALAGLIGAVKPQSDESVYDRVAGEAYAYADAMMKRTRTLHDPVEITPEEISRRQARMEQIPPVPILEG